MNFISKIYKKLLIAYNAFINSEQKETEKLADNNSNTSSSILFKIIDGDQIGIIINIPNISDDYDLDKIVYDAENYANFLVHITNGLVYEQVLMLVRKKMTEIKDTNNKLFLENVLYFFDAIEANLEKSLAEKINSDKPLIRPTQVFNVTPS